MTAPEPRTAGWGLGPEGESGWGSPLGLSFGLQLVAVLAIAENVIQLQFNLPIYISNLGDPSDGANLASYSFTPIVGSTGYDGTATRPITAAAVAFSTQGAGGTLPAGGTYGAFVDVTVDRPMTPYPSQYTVSVANIFSADLSQEINPSFASANFPGLFKQLIQASVELPTPTRDFANPQSHEQLVATALVPQNPNLLGVFVPDDTHDYAFDSGIIAYKKRILRRLMTVPGGFKHLGNSYGVGVSTYGKKLARAATIQALAAEAEKQIGQEPETVAVTVQAAVSQNNPGLVRFNIKVRVAGGKSFQFSPAFPTM